MAHGSSQPKNLSITWPFTFAALVAVFSLVWFCLGFAIHDRKPIDDSYEVSGPVELKWHYEIFQYGLYAALLICIGGYVFNHLRAKKRIAAEA